MVSPSQPQSRTGRSRFGIIAAIVALALVIGVGLMVYAMRTSGGWFVSGARPATPTREPAADYAPPQPNQITAAPAIDPQALATREATLAAQLAALEARTASVTAEAGAASGQAARAEAMLIAFAVRRALDRGVGLGYLEEQLRQRFGGSQPRATLTLLQVSRAPVTLEALRQGLDANAGELVAGGDGDMFASLVRELRTLVVIHKADAPSPRPAARLDRARRLLDAGQAEAALAEVERLPGAGQADAWTDAARRYVEARRALDVIEAAAILGHAESAAPQVPAISTPPASPVSQPAPAGQ